MSQAMPKLGHTDRAVLKRLTAGARTQGFLIDVTPHSRGQIQRSLDRLHMGEYVEKIHPGTALYEITEKGEEALDD